MIQPAPNDTLRFKKRPQCGLLIENARGEVLLQLRDNKPEIPFPNTWGTFGGQIEEGELPEEAIIREIMEELAYRPKALEQYGVFPCDGYDIYMFRCCDPDVSIQTVQVHEGQQALFFSSADLGAAGFAFNCREIVEDYFARFHPEQAVFIGLGSNMGNREEHLRKAVELLSRCIEITAKSSVYETEPVDYEDQGWFLNMVVQGRTRLFPEVLLEKLQLIESNLGRQRTIPKGPRTMDLDMLLYGEAIIATQRLTVPHPLLHERAFVLAPLAELAPGLMHPVLHTTIAVLLSQAAGRKQVIKQAGCLPNTENVPMKKVSVPGLLALVIAGAVLAGLLNLGRIINHAVNTYGPAFMKTEVRLGDADIRLFNAQAALQDIYIGNPQGFALPKLLSAKTVNIVFDRLPLFANPIIIDRLEIVAPDIDYEKTAKTDNFKTLLENMRADPSAGTHDGVSENAAEASGNMKQKGRKLLIRDLVIINAQITAITGPPGGKTLSLTIPELQLHNVGGSSGAHPKKIVRQVLTALYGKILSGAGPADRISGAAGDSAQSPGKSFKKGLDKAAGDIKKLFGK